MRVDQCVSAVRAAEVPKYVCLRSSCSHLTEIGGHKDPENRADSIIRNDRDFVEVIVMYFILLTELYRFHIKKQLMYTRLIHITLLAICYSNMFRSYKSHLQGERLIHFHSQINKLCTRCKIKVSEQLVLCDAANTCWSNTVLIKLCEYKCALAGLLQEIEKAHVNEKRENVQTFLNLNTSLSVSFQPTYGAVIQNQIWSSSKQNFPNAKCIALNSHIL